MFLLDALESRVHFEHLSEGLPGFGTETVVVSETASKGKKRETRLGTGRKKQKSAGAFQKSGSSKVVRFRNARRYLLLLRQGVSYLMLWRVVFTLSASATAFPPLEPSSLFSRLHAKGSRGKKRLGKEEAKVSVCIPKERITQGRPLQECKVWFVFVEEECFLLDALESRVHFERLSECHSAFDSKLIGVETASKEEAGAIKGWERKKQKSACAFQKSGSRKVVRFRNARCGLFLWRKSVSYSMLWRVVFTLSASASAFPPLKPMSFAPRLQARGSRGKEGGEGSKSACAFQKKRVKQGRPLVDWHATSIRKITKVASLLELFQRAVGFQGLCQNLATVWVKVATIETETKRKVRKEGKKTTIRSQQTQNKHDRESSTHCGATGCSGYNCKARPFSLDGRGKRKSLHPTFWRQPPQNSLEGTDAALLGSKHRQLRPCLWRGQIRTNKIHLEQRANLNRLPDLIRRHTLVPQRPRTKGVNSPRKVENIVASSACQRAPRRARLCRLRQCCFLEVALPVFNLDHAHVVQLQFDVPKHLLLPDPVLDGPTAVRQQQEELKVPIPASWQCIVRSVESVLHTDDVDQAASCQR